MYRTAREGNPGGSRRRAAAWALALWIVAAVALGAFRAAGGSVVWSAGTRPVWEPSSVAGHEPSRTNQAAERGPKQKKRPRERKPAERRGRRARVARRQKLALAVGHSLPVPVEKAPRYKLDNRHHDYPALDLTLGYGTPVRAVTAGRVRKVTRSGACGRGVIVRGRDGLTYTYCHGKRLLVRKGQVVSAGRTIMKSGNTGNSTGPHLHLQVASKRGRLLCPQHLLNKWQRGKKIPGWKVGRHRCVR